MSEVFACFSHTVVLTWNVNGSRNRTASIAFCVRIVTENILCGFLHGTFLFTLESLLFLIDKVRNKNINNFEERLL